MPHKPLNPLTRRVYEFVRDYIAQCHISPSYREVGDGCYVGHTTVLTHIAKLEGMGWLERDENRPRSLRLGPQAPDYPYGARPKP